MKLDVFVGGGLGDSVFLALQLPLYVRRGIEVTVAVSPDKDIIFRDCGVKIRHTRDKAPGVSWKNGESMDQLDPAAIWRCNIPAVNLGSPPFPHIGRAEELWDELCDVHFDVRRFIQHADWDAVDTFLAPLPRPIVLLHSKGNSCQSKKNLPDDVTLDLYTQLLEGMSGTIILLDWDNRVVRHRHPHVRHLIDDWERIKVPRLIALQHRSDLMIGIDSGPFYVAARFTDIPAVGFFPTAEHYPVRFGPPGGRLVHIVPGDLTPTWNHRARVAYNLIECGRRQFDMRHAARICAELLSGPRYLPADLLGKDVLLQELVQLASDEISGRPHRMSHGFALDKLLKTIQFRFVHPRIVVIGGIEQSDFRQRRGCLSYLLAILAQESSGNLTVLDTDGGRCETTNSSLRGIRHVDVHCGDPVTWIRQSHEATIDVLIFDICYAHNLELANLLQVVRLSPNALIGINLPQLESSPKVSFVLRQLTQELQNGWISTAEPGIHVFSKVNLCQQGRYRK